LGLASRSSALHCLYDAEISHGGSSCPQDDGKRGRRTARTIGGRSIPRPRDQRVEDNAFHLIGPKSSAAADWRKRSGQRRWTFPKKEEFPLFSSSLFQLS